jgi:hypothetical protein
MYFQKSNNNLMNNESPYFFIILFIVYIFLLIVAFILLKWSDNISKVFLNEEKNILIDIKNEKMLFSIALKIIGVIIIIKGLSELSRFIGDFFTISINTFEFKSDFFNKFSLGKLFSSIIILISGIYSIIGSESITKIIYKNKS